jgi:CoA:oxalate CoA-transferase
MEARRVLAESPTTVLAGTRVLELAQGWSSPAIAGRLLCELGATVIKIEPPEGDSLRRQPPSVNGRGIAFDLLAAGKQSVMLDYESSASDAETAHDLATTVDVVLDGRDIGARGRAVLNEARVRSGNPRVVWCEASLLGRDSPLAHWAGCDIVAQALSGFMTTTGFAEDPPTAAGVPLAEHAGAAFSVTAVLAALFHRHRAGEGQSIDIAGVDCLAYFLSSFLPASLIGISVPTRQGFRHPLMAPWDVYDAIDGKVVICAGHDAHWNAILQMIGRPDLVDDERYNSLPRRVERVTEVNALIQAWIGTKTADAAIVDLHAIGVPAGPILNLRQVFSHPHFTARGISTAESLDMRDPVLGSIYKMSRTPGRISRRAPGLDADRAVVLDRRVRSPRVAV